MTSSPTNSWLAFDIGGANIKAADGQGWSHSEPFAMWQEWKRLPDAIRHIQSLHPARHHAVTMTGEIADCFSERSDGVRHIVQSCCLATGTNNVFFYSVAGVFVNAKEAIHHPLDVAASNWHALARLAGSLAPSGNSCLIDIGSTTTDIVPISCGKPAPKGLTDWDRLIHDELIYTGMERTPLPTLVHALPHRGTMRPLAREWFATTQDVWLLLDCLEEDSMSDNTADRKPVTRDAARVRIARTMLLEPNAFTLADAIEAAEAIATSQMILIKDAMEPIRQHQQKEDCIVLSGQGETIARKVLSHMNWEPRTISLKHAYGDKISRVAPAHAVALIARQIL
ncbi:MAG: hypothetical protein HOH16_06780 [Planctomycetaceae bacterium]|nr:hypothetical protein [Planctomycetaceae bacterium]